MNRREFFRGVAAAAAAIAQAPVPESLQPEWLSLFGDGSDGDLVLKPGMSFNLLRDMSFRSLTLEPDACLSSDTFRGGYRVAFQTVRLTAPGEPADSGSRLDTDASGAPSLVSADQGAAACRALPSGRRGTS